MNDLSLFDVSTTTQAEVDRGQRGRARRSDPRTSHDAAATIRDGAEKAIRRVFAIPRDLTADEIHQLCPEFERDTLRTAISRLKNSKFLYDTGRTRLSLRGHPMAVYKRSTERAAT